MAKIIHRILCTSDECPQRGVCFRRNAKRQGFVSDQSPNHDDYYDALGRNGWWRKYKRMMCPYFLSDKRIITDMKPYCQEDPCNNWLDRVVELASVKPYYRDNDVVIFNADCKEIVPHMPKACLLLTDPPYGININKSNRLSVSRGFGEETWDSEPIDTVLLDSLRTTSRSQIIWGGNYYMLNPSRCFFVWDKKNDGRDFADCEYAWTNLDSVARIFRMRPMNMDGGKVHPTQKPVELIKWCIDLAGDKVQTILDPFAGSGTTGRAAKDLGRKCVLIELEEKYCEIAAKRMMQECLPLEFD